MHDYKTDEEAGRYEPYCRRGVQFKLKKKKESMEILINYYICVQGPKCKHNEKLKP